MDSHERACGLADNRANRFQQTSFIFTPPINGIGQAGRHPIPDIPHNIETMLAWDSLSVLTEYLGVAEREGPDALAQMLGRYRPQIEPLLIAGRCVRRYSQSYPQSCAADLLWVLVGFCGVKQIEPQIVLSRTERCIYTDKDDERPTHQPYPLAQAMRWLAEGRFTKSYQDKQRQYVIKLTQVSDFSATSEKPAKKPSLTFSRRTARWPKPSPFCATATVLIIARNCTPCSRRRNTWT